MAAAARERERERLGARPCMQQIGGIAIHVARVAYATEYSYVAIARARGSRWSGARDQIALPAVRGSNAPAPPRRTRPTATHARRISHRVAARALRNDSR